MSKMKKIVTALCLAGVGAVALWGTQWVMHKTSSPEFCVSCHSMSFCTLFFSPIKSIFSTFPSHHQNVICLPVLSLVLY